MSVNLFLYTGGTRTPSPMSFSSETRFFKVNHDNDLLCFTDRYVTLGQIEGLKIHFNPQTPHKTHLFN